MKVIEVEHVSKKYILGSLGTGTFKEDFLKMFNKNDSQQISNFEDSEKEYWALKDVSFSVSQGEAVGIVGKNGAGKSTLLKILSRITSPTTGDIRVKGRIASLLEVGTGFHPELTGRDNIFLNGAILGMKKYEIRSKFNEIVAFSGIEKFIDTPVKRYSSGMYVRLAFAVAAHLEPEILIIDEVLAVGDAEFQKKCLGKMNEVAGQGRTVLFVSHNMAAVKSLCSKAVLLKNGKVVLQGVTDNVINEYLKEGSDILNHKLISNISAEGVQIHEIKVNAKGKEPSEPIIETDVIELTTVFYIEKNFEQYSITFHLNNELGEPLFSFWNDTPGCTLVNGMNRLKCIIPAPFFNSGNFFISLLVVKNKSVAILLERDIVSFTINDKEHEIGTWMGREPGFLRPKFLWENNSGK